MGYLFNKYPLDKDRRQCKKVEKFIQDYSLNLKDYYSDCNSNNENEDYLLLRSDFDEMIESIQTLYLSSTYIGLMSWLVDRAFLIVPQSKGKKEKSFSQTDFNKAILLKTLYNINPQNLLKIFSKNA